MAEHLSIRWNNHQSSFSRLIEKLYFETQYSDGTILCEGKSYPVHGFVLSTCSEYFEEIFDHAMHINNKYPFIVVKDIKREQMEALLCYMYKGEVNVPQDKLPDLVEAAEAFKIKGIAVPDYEDGAKKRKLPKSPAIKAKRAKQTRSNASHEEDGPWNNDGEDSDEDSDVIETIDDSQLQADGEQNNQDLSHIFGDDVNATNLPNSLAMGLLSSGLTIEKKTIKRASGSRQKFGKLHQCEYCEYSTHHSQHLIEHTRRHTGEKPFACNQCDFRSAQKRSIKKHMLVHSKEGASFKCDLCNYTSNRKNIIKVHMRRHHGVNEEEEEAEECNNMDMIANEGNNVTMVNNDAPISLVQNSDPIPLIQNNPPPNNAPMIHHNQQPNQMIHNDAPIPLIHNDGSQ